MSILHIYKQRKLSKGKRYTACVSTITHRQAVNELLENYSLCGYPLDQQQIHSMLTTQIDKGALKRLLAMLVVENQVAFDHRKYWYTKYGSEINFKYRRERAHISSKKKQKVARYLRLLYAFPWIELVLLTGSCAIENAKESDDIDLMIITSPNTMFICRLYSYICSRILRVGRRRLVESQPDTVCTNIWLDSSDLAVPETKINTYSAREIVNAGILFDRSGLFATLITANAWIYRMLPNWQNKEICMERKRFTTRWFIKIVNEWLGYFQLWYMHSHVTEEIVSMTQLWLHPRLHQ